VAKLGERKLAKSRWTDDTIKKMVAAMKRGRVKPISTPILKNDIEYLDCAGFTINAMIQKKSFSYVSFRFLSSTAGGMMVICNFDHCDFSDADYQSNLGDHFSHCLFTKANLKRTWLRGTFIECDFTDASLRIVKSYELKFVNCRFVRTDFRSVHLRKTTFDKCIFEDCVFGKGSLVDSHFVACQMESIDFADMIMDDVVIDKQ
jgi:uncharacterized protein YjbI with pentapeptide repeats